jgi:hypothetical protein
MPQGFNFERIFLLEYNNQINTMASVFLVLVTLLLSINHSEQLQSSHSQTLLRIQQLLNFPSALRNWNNSTDFCNTDSNSSLTVVCYEDTITQLHIIGEGKTQPN